MQSPPSKVIIASAGSGKTSFLIDEALSRPDRRIAVLTYTNNNICTIKNRFCKKLGGIPPRVDVMTWFAFLLHECVRPYQRAVYTKSRVKTVFFPEGRSPCAPYGRTGQYYFQNGDAIYSDKISRFVIDCEAKTNGSVTTRLCQLYDDIFIDELQDLSGYDLDLLEVFLRSRLRVVMVGDPRQCTYVTNNAAKNSQYRGIGILKLIHQWQQAGLFQVETHARSFRCNQQICDYSDALWPDMDATVSHNTETTGHDGVFIVKQEDMDDYIERFSPTILRYNKNADSAGYPALNFGNAKGLEFERVLIIPHGPIKKYIQSGNQRWTPFFGPRNAEIKLGFQALS